MSKTGHEDLVFEASGGMRHRQDPDNHHQNILG
jgi:hypothetical protein